MSLLMLYIKICGHKMLLCLKGPVIDSNPIHFLSNFTNISSQSISFPLCVCALKEILELVHSPGSVKGKTKKVAWTEPHNAVAANHTKGG